VSSNQTAEALIAKLHELHPKGWDLSLTRILHLLEKLGNPHLKLPPVIHIAGTNGKGSASAFARALLEAAGYRVHVHTSPHLVNWHERYRLGQAGGGHFVSDAVLAEALGRAMRVNEDAPITVFEVMTAVTFLLFAEHPADAIILEVGLGGRLDATNVIEHPAATLIMSISLDHQDYLGSEIEGIAREKAGIIKQGAPLVVGCQQEERIYDILSCEAHARGVKAHLFGQDYLGVQEQGRFIFQNEQGLMDLPHPRLNGDFQFANAAAAMEAVRLAGFSLDETACARAMETVDWPGRLQKITQGVLRQTLPQQIELWLDGGHNPEAGLMVAQFLKSRQRRDNVEIFLISGMINTKDAKHYFAAFKDCASCVYTVPVEMSDAGIDPVELAEAAQAGGVPAYATGSIEAALATIAKRLEGDRPILEHFPKSVQRFSDKKCGENKNLEHWLEPSEGKSALVMICGSLYLVGQALQLNGTSPT